MKRYKYTGGPIKEKWFKKGREYEKNKQKKVNNENENLSPIIEIVNAEVKDIIKRNKHSK